MKKVNKRMLSKNELIQTNGGKASGFSSLAKQELVSGTVGYRQEIVIADRPKDRKDDWHPPVLK